MLFPWLAVFDVNTVRANFKKPIDLKKIKTRSGDFALLVPIFNNLKYLTNIEFLKKYREHVILCTTSNETNEFYESLWDLHEKYGFRVTLSAVGGTGKNPWIIYNKTLLAHDAVLKETINVIKEKYVIFVDGDTFVDGELDVLAGAMDELHYDIASVRILPGKRENIIEHLQGIEYDVAMQARLIYPWLTSGAGMIAKRDVMINIMKNHSLFFNGGDIEIGKLADMMGYSVGHLPMDFYTDVPNTWKGWIKQRFSWMCGCFRHSIINLDHNLKHPFHFIYYTFVIYFLWPFKLIEMMRHVYLIPIILGLYCVLTYIVNWRVRNKWMLIFPFYALFQVLVLTWFGIYRYISTVVKTGNVGRIKLKYNPKNISIFNPKYTLKFLSNYSIVVSTVVILTLLISSTAQKAVFGREYEAVDLAATAITKTKDTLANVGKPNNAQPGVVAGASTVNFDGSYPIKEYKGQDNTQIAYQALYLFAAEYGVELSDEKVQSLAAEMLKDPMFGKTRSNGYIYIDKKYISNYAYK